MSWIEGLIKWLAEGGTQGSESNSNWADRELDFCWRFLRHLPRRSAQPIRAANPMRLPCAAGLLGRPAARRRTLALGFEPLPYRHDPQTVGRPAIRGLRILVKDVLDLLAAGAGREEILRDYPYLEAEDITAVLEYAAVQSDRPIVVSQ